MNAVITCCFGDKYNELAKLTHPTIKAYAEKIGADFVVINEKKVSKKYVQYEKFQLRDYFNKRHHSQT